MWKALTVFKPSPPLFMSSLSGAYVGYHLGIVNGLSSTIVDCDFFPNNTSSSKDVYRGIFTASFLVGAAIGCFLLVPFANRYGRKPAYLISGIFGLASIMMGAVQNFWVIVIFRLIAGFPSATSTLVPLYVTEVADPSVRGALGTLYQVFITFFIFIAFLVNYVFMPDYDPRNDDLKCVTTWKWRVELGLSAIPSVLMIIHALFAFPESKVWLENRRENKLPRNDIETVRVGLNATSDEQGWSWKQMLMTKSGLRNSMTALAFGASIQLTGINGLIFYSNQVFSDSGLSNITLITLLVVGLWNFLSVFASLALVDYVGRRILMIVSLAVCAAANLLLSVSSATLDEESLGRFVCTIIAVMIFLLFFEIGPGGLFFIMASEMFPPHIRSKALAISNVANNGANILVSLLFPILTNEIGDLATFLIFTGCCISSAIFVFFVVHETKGELHYDD